MIDHLYVGEARVLLATIKVAGLPVNIASGEHELTELEFNLKPDLKPETPLTLQKTTVNGGIVLLPQSGATLGQVKITLTTANTRGLATRSYYYELVGLFAAAPGERIVIVEPTQVPVRPVVRVPA